MARAQPILKHWPVWLAPLTATVLPATTVRRTEPMRLWQAAIVHGVGVVLTLAVAAGVLAWSLSDDLLDAGAWRTAFVDLVTEVGEAVADVQLALSLVSLALAAEGAVAIVAWWLMAWGARDELVPTAFKASLRRVWCATPHAALLLLLLGLVTVPLERAWWSAMEDYTVAMADRRWYVRHAHELIGMAWCVFGLWGFVLLLRVGVARDWSARCRWPAVCDGCGYTLLGIEREGACPECGRPVEASVGAAARPGVFGARPEEAPGKLATKPRRFVERGAMVSPTRFGRQLRALHPEGGHRKQLLLNALLIGAISAAGGMGLTAIMSMGWWAGLSDALMAGAMASIGTIVLTLGMASLMGSMATRLTLFPLMHVACQGACCLSRLLIGWVIGNWVVVIMLVLTADRFVGGAEGLRWISMAVVAANMAVLALYMVLLWRMVMAARFANW